MMPIDPFFTSAVKGPSRPAGQRDFADQKQLLGKSPRSFVPGGVPIRRGDVLAVHQVTMAVATRR